MESTFLRKHIIQISKIVQLTCVKFFLEKLNCNMVNVGNLLENIMAQDIDSGNTYYHNLLDGVKAGYCSMKDAMFLRLFLCFPSNSISIILHDVKNIVILQGCIVSGMESLLIPWQRACPALFKLITPNWVIELAAEPQVPPGSLFSLSKHREKSSCIVELVEGINIYIYVLKRKKDQTVGRNWNLCLILRHPFEDVDGALFNTLRVRFELGLFDPIEGQAYWKLGQGNAVTPTHRNGCWNRVRLIHFTCKGCLVGTHLWRVTKN